ncbi:hypothetical protein AMS68_004768 [Peltaster fructicola]|uniref:Methyltransferase domain-containing protein n=1 Tax=Peltaster fructicola TaxID=286661 RepID=A0A6H0XX63_9PEZI|nr:hypothetical protein AMS68_004768 [Peltaster fructicola]
MSSTTVIESKVDEKFETPFTTAVLDNDTTFWREYIAGRPSPSDGFFHLINEYQAGVGDYHRKVAHDVGTGPGNIAARLAKYYDHVVGSDVNDQALAAVPALISADVYNRMTTVKAPAEQLSSGVVPAAVGKGKTDLLVVSECMPLLDPVASVQAFNELLRPNGALAIYFYGRPLFADGNKDECDQIYDRIATRICSFLLPFKGTPGFPFHQRGAEALVSWLDNIAFPRDSWTRVQRYKWNSNVPLLFNSKDGYDFEFERVDRRQEGEVTKEFIDRSYWQDDWDIKRIAGYLASVYPNYQKKAGERYVEIEKMLEELDVAMGKTERRVSFPVSLILATKK